MSPFIHSRHVFSEHVGRSVVKSITFRVVVIASDLTVIYLIIHRVDATIGIVAATNLSSTVLYFLHERVWNKIHWGKSSVK